MIKPFKKMLVFVFLLALGSCGEGQKATPSDTGAGDKAAKEAPTKAGATFANASVEALFHNYLALRDALVSSDFDQARHVVLSMKSLGLEAFPEVAESVDLLSESTELGQLRMHFLPLSVHLKPILEQSLKAGTIYNQFCPMAFHNQGGFWFSESEDILNPYFGSAMLRCGKVQETISKG